MADTAPNGETRDAYRGISTSTDNEIVLKKPVINVSPRQSWADSCYRTIVRDGNFSHARQRYEYAVAGICCARYRHVAIPPDGEASLCITQDRESGADILCVAWLKYAVRLQYACFRPVTCQGESLRIFVELIMQIYSLCDSLR